MFAANALTHESFPILRTARPSTHPCRSLPIAFVFLFMKSLRSILPVAALGTRPGAARSQQQRTSILAARSFVEAVRLRFFLERRISHQNFGDSASFLSQLPDLLSERRYNIPATNGSNPAQGKHNQRAYRPKAPRFLPYISGRIKIPCPLALFPCRLRRQHSG
jgi:hypothetical protein